MESTLAPVQPVQPAAGYIGGKRNLARRLIQLIDTVDHDTYAEPFVGMGGVFLRRRRRPGGEVINDWSGEVSNFYRVAQNHYVAFLDMLRWQITSRAEFERLQRVDPSTLTDLQRAARFLYLQRTSFGGKVHGRVFGVTPGRRGAFDVTQLGPILDALHDRLAGVIIERLTWQAFLARYDRPRTLFYLDPPYYGCERDYGPDMFRREEFEDMAARLAQLQGRFILSINDRPEVRQIFAAFKTAPVELTYQVSGRPTKGRELIITS